MNYDVNKIYPIGERPKIRVYKMDGWWWVLIPRAISTTTLYRDRIMIGCSIRNFYLHESALYSALSWQKELYILWTGLGLNDRLQK